jgi:hypothetical protein
MFCKVRFGFCWSIDNADHLKADETPFLPTTHSRFNGEAAHCSKGVCPPQYLEERLSTMVGRNGWKGLMSSKVNYLLLRMIRPTALGGREMVQIVLM